MTVAHFLNTSPWVWPICFLSNQILPMLALAFTGPKSPIRRFTMLFVVLSAYQFSHTISNFAPTDAHAAVRAASMCFTIMFLFNNNDLLNLTCVSYEQHIAWKRSLVTTESKNVGSGEEAKEKLKIRMAQEEPLVEGSLWKRLKWSAGMCWNFRRMQTQHQISFINPFSTKNPSYIPSRANFLIRTTFLLVLSKYMLDLSDYGLVPPERMVHLLERRYLRFFPRLFAVSFPETIFRSSQVISFWIKCGMGQFHCYELFAFIFVGLGIQSPEQWPPYFGFASEAWSVRQFWGSTWHQTFRVWLTTNVDFFVFSMLRFPRGSLVTRYTRLILSFLISGLLHLAMEYQHGFTAGEAGSVNFFVLQALGIMLEDLAQAIAQKCFPRMDEDVKRWIGYIWVAAFLLETTPVWFYSQSLYLMTKHGATIMYPQAGNEKAELLASSVFVDSMLLKTNVSMLGGRRSY